jgi:hypothetical protein
VAFAWTPVADRGDGAGSDYFVSGLDHYLSWVTVGNGLTRTQLASTPGVRALTVSGLGARETACVHVQAFDRVGNASAEGAACAAPLAPPPTPSWPPPSSAVAANPDAPGLVGLDSWLWLAPAPVAISADEVYQGIRYTVSATPVGVTWDFGDGSTAGYANRDGFGRQYPEQSPVTHTYQAHSETGYEVRAWIRYVVTWTATVDGRAFGPYPLGAVTLPAGPLRYPVEQAQPELIRT